MLLHPDFKRLVTRIVITVGGLAAFVASVAQIREHLFTPRQAAAELAPAPAPIVVIAPPEPKPEAALPDLPISGAWSFIHTAERTTYRPYQDLESVYRINLRHDGRGAVEGNGELWSEGGQEVTGANHLLIDFRGTFDGDELHLSFTVQALRRPFTGSANFRFDPESSHWIGRYESGAAASSGPARLVPRDG